MFNFAYADAEGNAYEHPRYFALGRLGNTFVEPAEEELIPLPEGASLVMIPNRLAVVMDNKGNFKRYNEAGLTLGALLPQGYTRTLLPAFINQDKNAPLPLFGYAAVAIKNGKIYTAAVKTDVDNKWNPENYNSEDLQEKVLRFSAKFNNNRIIKQLSYCALNYSCFTAQNIFYQRWEGGIPVSPVCNAACLGCISLQPAESCPSPQQRIKFTPEAPEIREIAVEHLSNAEDAIISFGQGCEGEPSLQADLIATSIKQVREKTNKGTINMNTNAGYTEGIKKICRAGIDSLRISMNSAVKEMYEAYYRPTNYNLDNVKDSLLIAQEESVYTYLNLLCFPGITDCEKEVEQLISFVKETGVKGMQLRNLNIDPDVLTQSLPEPEGQALGVPAFLQILKEELPNVELGNYTKPVHKEEICKSTVD